MKVPQAKGWTGGLLMHRGGQRPATPAWTSVLAVGALLLVLLLPAPLTGAEELVAAPGVEVTAHAYRNGTTTLEMRPLEPVNVDAEMQHWSACRGTWMMAPLTATCGPSLHDAARFHQTQTLVLEAGTTGTFNTTLGTWTVSCIAIGGLFTCQDAGDPLWDEPLVHRCSAKAPGTSLPGGVGLWDCMAQEV